MRVGIYGGTFSPAHIGHIVAARAFSEQIKLDKLIIIPANIPPHKECDGKASADERLHMCRLAFEGVGEVSDMEICRRGRSYTYDTVRELEALGYDDIYMLCGTDMFLTFEKWYRFEYILKKVTLTLALRSLPTQSERAEIDAKKAELSKKYAARIEELCTEPVNISSTEIRDMISRGEDVSAYLPATEYKYIKEKRLYI